MIRGVVTSDLEAWVDLAIVCADLPAVGFSAVIDTGFSDYLTLPRSVLEKFQAAQRSHARVVLADGSEREVRLGACNALDCVVESGLEAGDRLGRRG